MQPRLFSSVHESPIGEDGRNVKYGVAIWPDPPIESTPDSAPEICRSPPLSSNLKQERMRHTISLVLLAAAPVLAQQRLAQQGLAQQDLAQPYVERSLPTFFIPNFGQTDPSVRFMVDTPELRAGFTAGSAIFQLDRLTLRVRFAGANAQAVIEGVKPLSAHANFLIGNRPRDWHTNLPLYQKILYRDLYPGIDMSYGGAGHRIKSEFLVAPEADPNQIRLDYSGARLSIAPNGDLLVHIGNSVGNAEAREEAPVIYQEAAPGGENRAGRVAIPGRYSLLDAHTVGFELAAYDHSRPLMIDPVLSYATYLGGSGMSAVTGVAVDSSGDLYVTGWTESLNFQIAGPIQASNEGSVNAFVAKLSPAGSGLLYATYMGGSGDDQGAAIAVDSSGEAYVTGSTTSPNFPLVSPLSAALGGGRDAFVLKLNALGSMLLFSTYLGGANTDTGNAIAVDSLDNAYIAGDTHSVNFPVLDPEQPALAGDQNAFITKLSSAGAMVFSTFLGGSGVDHAGGIALDSSRDVYVAGGTTSINFPVVAAIQAVTGGGQDAFLTKLNSAGSGIVYSTYLGGTGGGPENPELANAVAVDASGNAYIAGATNSVNFPVTAGALQASFSAVEDAFAAEVNAAGNALVYSTYLGGSAFNWANGLAVAAGGIAYVAGYTSSFDFPVVAPVQASFGGLYDAFVSVFNAAGSALSFSTFYGGSGSDEGNAIAVDASGNMYFGGQTSSLNLTLLDPIQSTNAGYAIGWLARLGVAAAPPLPSVISLSPVSGSGNSATFTAQFSDPAGVAALASVVLLVNTTPSPNYGCQVTYSISTGQFALADDVASSGSTLVNPGSGAAENDQCTLNGSGSYVTTAGTTLTVVVSISFQPGFAGSDTVYLSAVDTSGNTTGLVSGGTWTVTASQPMPAVGSVSPNGGMGSAQTFTFVFSDTQNAQNITGMNMLFTPASFANACYIMVDTTAGTVALGLDSGVGSSSKPLSSGILLSNSQCTVGATTLTISGLSAILTVAVAFTSAFSGVQNIYMYASDSDANTTGWVLKGTYTVSAGGVLAVNLVSPSSGAVGVSLTASLIWDAAVGATSYDVYLGTSSIPPFVVNTTATTYSPGTLAPVTTYYWYIVARNASGTAPSATWSFTTQASAGALQFYPIAPCRLVDTRGAAAGFNGITPFSGPSIPAGGTLTIPVQSPTEAVANTTPAPCGAISSTAQAYSFNITVVPAGFTVASPGGAVDYVSLWPAGSPQPFVSTLDDPEGLIVANAAIVPAGAPSGGVSVYNQGPAATDVIIDMDGYFAPPASGLQFYPVAPCRLVDTRGAAAGFNGIDPFAGPSILAGGTLTVPVQSATEASTDTAPAPCGVIPSTAQAYSFNLTVVPQAGGAVDYVSLWPAGSAQPFVSTLDDPEGLNVSNAAIVPAGKPNGGVSVYNQGPATTNVVIDMNGYFAPPTTALQFYPVAPCRLVDTRGAAAGFNGIEPFSGPSIPALGTLTIPVQSAIEAGTNTTPAPCGTIPSTAQAYSFNLTVVPVAEGRVDYVSLWPAGATQPFVSTLDDPEGLIVANAAIVPAGAPSGGISVYNAGPAATNVVIDMNGYFAP
jgi:hypothetical protein